MASPPPEKSQGLPNPYAAKSLPNPYAHATVAESAPVRYSDEKAEPKKSTAFHNPHNIKRPVAKGAVTNKRPPMAPRPAVVSSDPAATATPNEQRSIDYWRSTADDDASTLEWRRREQQEQREKKKREKKLHKQFGYWYPEMPYKADKPSNLRAFRASGAYRERLQGFSSFLTQFRPTHSSEVSSDPIKPASSASSPASESHEVKPKPSFAPPASYDQDKPAANPSPVTEAASGEDASARRARLVQSLASPPPSHVAPLPSALAPVNSPQPPLPTQPTQPAPYSATISAPPIKYSHTISAPPVRYDVPSKQNQNAADRPAADERPAKKQKLTPAEAMMQKMGFIKGQGLGKNNDGITSHLYHKVRKGDSKQSVSKLNSFDNDDWNAKAKAQPVFDILGGVPVKQKEVARFGEDSCVIVAWGCVDDIDWEADAERSDGGIIQEMADVFNPKFGEVERFYINKDGKGQPVYIKFQSVFSALNAVNRFDEGYQFRGRNIRAQFYPEKKFETQAWDH
ncbi:unnamed protein product [Periconia digitata]|uniref:G-patch domain-containing protein n=1 Tax=Periconia digitata TaxID=1303443 RepID=A0A9W4XRR1_9PLEO|nr:unnamed protein product [Periconia digitata]